MIRAILALGLTSMAAICQANDFSSPAEACAYMASKGMPTQQWKDYGDGWGYGCNSTYRELGTSNSGLANNLAYYVDGEDTAVTQLKLVLNVNQPVTEQHAKNQLIEASQALTEMAISQSVPPNVLAGLANGQKVVAESESKTFEVKRIDWPTGRGYELHFIIR